MSWGQPRTLPEKLFAGALSPASAVYGLGSYLRLQSYASGMIERKRLSVPVISIGNITCGGTGKTPVTIDLALRLVAAGRRVAILTRGYKRSSTDLHVTVSQGNGPQVASDIAGDEPFLISSSVPEAIVVVGTNRADSGRIAIEELGADIILLDDGFQHIKLERDSDIVLVDYHDDPKLDHLLPAGRLREPLSALGRASTIVITRLPESIDHDKLVQLNETLAQYAPNAQITAARFLPAKCKVGGKSISPQALSGKRAILFCGIARPQSFVNTAANLGINICAQHIFGDHYWFTEGDLKKLQVQLCRRDADYLLTTEKDYARLSCLPLPHQLKDRIVTIGLSVSWVGGLPSAVEEYLCAVTGVAAKAVATSATTDFSPPVEPQPNPIASPDPHCAVISQSNLTAPPDSQSATTAPRPHSAPNPNVSQAHLHTAKAADAHLT